MAGGVHGENMSRIPIKRTRRKFLLQCLLSAIFWQVFPTMIVFSTLNIVIWLLWSRSRKSAHAKWAMRVTWWKTFRVQRNKFVCITPITEIPTILHQQLHNCWPIGILIRSHLSKMSTSVLLEAQPQVHFQFLRQERKCNRVSRSKRKMTPRLSGRIHRRVLDDEEWRALTKSTRVGRILPKNFPAHEDKIEANSSYDRLILVGFLGTSRCIRKKRKS